MKEFADLLLKSMIEHDPSILPLGESYAATENSKAAALNMMSSWRTVTGIKQIGQYVMDKKEGQLFFTANLDESGLSALFYARLKIENKAITEIELFISRSRSDCGFVFLPDEITRLPKGWISPIPEGKRAGREELTRFGRAIFDINIPAPEASPDCVLMEAGGIVYEDPEYLQTVLSDDSYNKKADTKVTIPGGLWPDRPVDPDARLLVVDEEQGIVVSSAIIPGFVSPYIVPNATESCFVPASMMENHRKTLKPDAFKERKVMREMPAAGVTIEIMRYHSNLIQGLHRYVSIQGPGIVSPWISK